MYGTSVLAEVAFPNVDNDSTIKEALLVPVLRVLSSTSALLSAVRGHGLGNTGALGSWKMEDPRRATSGRHCSLLCMVKTVL